MSLSWLLLQLSDSAFPTGGFAHSYGLEAAAQLGELSTPGALEKHARDWLWQQGYAGLPLVSAAHPLLTQGPPDVAGLALLDQKADAFLVSAVANEASRTQGRALLDTCARIFPHELEPVRAQLRLRQLRLHHAPVFGALVGRLGIGLEACQRLYLSLGFRGLLSAAVRLNLVGTHEAQSLQHAQTALLDEVWRTCAKLTANELSQTAPLLELFGSLHPRLYSRLFLS